MRVDRLSPRNPSRRQKTRYHSRQEANVGSRIDAEDGESTTDHQPEKGSDQTTAGQSQAKSAEIQSDDHLWAQLRNWQIRTK